MIKVEGLPLDIPVTDLVLAFMPLVAAAILVYREEGSCGARRLLKRIFDYERVQRKIWYVPVVLLNPLLFLLIYGTMLLLRRSLPSISRIPFLSIPFLFILFFVLAIGEEIGWTGYATDPLQEKWSALTAGIILGLVSIIAHYPSMLVQGRSPKWIAWSTFGITGLRVLMVWLYNNTGNSVFAVILFHAVTNTGRSIFPGGCSAYELGDAVVGYVIITITAVIVVFVVFLWGSKTLARFRYFRPAS